MAGRTNTWLGLGLSGLAVVVLLADGIASALIPPPLAREMAATGWGLWTGPVVGALAIVSALVYALPRTAMLGAILITGFSGGAISAHLRLGEIGSPAELVCLAIGCAAWGGLWLRDARVRAMLPLVR